MKKAKESPIVVESKPFSLFSEADTELFLAGKHFSLHEKLGSHLVTHNHKKGVYFAVWAPNAAQVSVMGDFNAWSRFSHPLLRRADHSGIWEGFVADVGMGAVYKYFIKGADGENIEKGDPFARRWEHPPATASIVWSPLYAWKDKRWLKKRAKLNSLQAPISVYELHLGSWRRDPGNPDRVLTYTEIATSLVSYILEMGFTHVECMPLSEYPYYPSWGYQITGYYAASSRHGLPEELMFLIDELHRNDIGVILDWVPSHFPGDAHGLYRFDGTHLFEHADMRKGFHPDWKSYLFNYDRNEVRSFLISNAMFWLDQFHVDGLRVDALASMLSFSFSRSPEESGKNALGGTENLGAIQFFKDLNVAVYEKFPGVHTIAEDSSTFPGVTRPVHFGGLGFGMKWMMGWMNDTLKYFANDPIYRTYHHHQLTFSLTYAFSENFMLPLSHDEVVHGKSSMIYKMPGDEWQKFANLRTLYAYMFTHPGAKLLFMGNEFAQTREWDFTGSLDWHLLQYAPHRGMAKLIKQLNALYRSEPALYELSFDASGFEWIDADDAAHSIFAYKRKGKRPKDDLIVVLNLTPVVRNSYSIRLQKKTNWVEIFNTDAEQYYGSNQLNAEILKPTRIIDNNYSFALQVNLPPLSCLVLKATGKKS